MLGVLVKRDVLAAIARTVDQDGDESRAQSELDRTDPVLRPLARRVLHQSVLEAALAIGSKAHDSGHCLRLAYLHLSGVELEARLVTNRSDAAALFAEKQRLGPRRPRRWLFSGVLIASCLAIVAAATLAMVRNREGTGLFASADLPTAPPPSGAYASGGVPKRGSADVDTALFDTLPRYVIAANGAARSSPPSAELAEIQQDLLSQPVRAELGAELSSLIERLLGDIHAAAVTPADDIDPIADQMARTVLMINDRFAANNLAYFLDSNVLTHEEGDPATVIVFVFVVERANVYQHEGPPLRALHVRRRDQLNWQYRLLGFTAAQRREALILSDNVESRMFAEVLPSINALAPTELLTGERQQFEQPWHRRARQVAATTLASAFAPSSGAAELLAQTLAKRVRLFAPVRSEIEEIDTLRIPLESRVQLRSLLSFDEMNALMEIERALAEKSMAEAAGQVRDKMMLTVEMHELQHRLDVQRGALPMPAALERYTGPLRDQQGHERPVPAHAQAELSAYLAELARVPDSSAVGLTLLSRFLFDERAWGTPESYASLVIFTELGRRTGVLGSAPLVETPSVNRNAVAELYERLATLPADALAAAAKATWQELFEAPLPSLTLID